DNAGLLPYGDYIVGTPEGNVHGESGLGELVEDYLGRSLRLYVYNHEYAVTRLVTLTPSRSWGGSGALGCVLGFGALHRLPAPMEEPIAAADGTVFEAARFSNEQHRSPSTQPAVQSPSSYPPPSSATQSSIPAAAGPPKGATRKPRAAAASNMTFDEYFREGEQKSKEEDFAPSTKSAGPPPPPPKSAKALPLAKSAEPVAETEEEGDEGEDVEQAQPEQETEQEKETEPGAGMGHIFRRMVRTKTLTTSPLMGKHSTIEEAAAGVSHAETDADAAAGKSEGIASSMGLQAIDD
ncbi:MAG: hypothetical protein Q9184_003385, partial [Pyrenodesmia sp. 2 TL-2023]